MHYTHVAIPEEEIPQAVSPVFQHLLDTYVSEVNKVASVWLEFASSDLTFRPDARSSSVAEIMKHQMLSERRFFGEFLGTPEPAAEAVLPHPETLDTFRSRLVELAQARLPFFALQTQDWWLQQVGFFDVTRQRIWIFWRRVLHTAHHRTQLAMYLRMLGKQVPPIYGPTADVTWSGADPTNTVEAAKRR